MVNPTPDQPGGREAVAQSEGTGSGVLELSGPQSSEGSHPGVPQDRLLSSSQVSEGPELARTAPLTYSQRTLRVTAWLL